MQDQGPKESQDSKAHQDHLDDRVPTAPQVFQGPRG